MREEHIFYAVVATSALILALVVTAVWLAAYRKAGRRRVAAAALFVAALNPLISAMCGFSEQPDRRYDYYVCCTNLRSLAQAIVTYAYISENGPLLPDRLDLLYPEHAPRDHYYTCPLSGDQVASADNPAAFRAALAIPNHLSYLYFGQGLRTQDLTPAHVLACDEPHNHDRGQYDLWVLYGDFSVRPVPRPQLEKLLAELQSDHNPPRPDHLR